MTKDVLVSIKGFQMEIDDDEAVEVIAPGQYYKKNGKHYIMFDEVHTDEYDQNHITKSTIKIHDRHVSIIKKGLNNVHMEFEQNKKNLTPYSTPFGNMMIGLNTTLVEIEENTDELNLYLEYDLDINYNHVSECTISVSVKSK